MQKIVDASNGSNIAEAAEIIRRGGIVAFPTETVYGLGADAGNALAVARLFEAKNRPRIDPIIVHISRREDAHQYGTFPPIATELMNRFWPGPLTLVVPKTDRIPSIVTAGLDTVGIRMPAHPAALALIRMSGRPVAAPSANVFGAVSPTEAQHVAEQLADRVDLILDGGKARVGVESTILSLTSPLPRILRAGGISPEEIESIIPIAPLTLATQTIPEAPGQLARHYSTRTPLKILTPNDCRAQPDEGERVGLVCLTPSAGLERYVAVETLSASGNLREAAANLFAALHRLDRLSLDRLVAYPFPERGLGIAIMDRLRGCAVP
jgi:L-threonylcarbamoyladenylate synthase